MEKSFYPRFSDREYQRRNRLVKEMMKSKEVDCLLLYNSSKSTNTVSFLSNFISPSPAYLLYPLEGEPTLLLHFRNHIPCAKDMSTVEDVQWHLNNPANCVSQNLILKKLERSKIGVVSSNTIPYSQLTGIKEKLPEADFVDVTSDYNWIRWVRSEEELEWFRKSAHLTDLTMGALEAKIRPGLTLHDLNAIIHEAFLKQGGDLGLAFLASTSMAEPSIFVPWQVPTFKTITKGDVVITEITVTYHGYGTQLHRPFAVAAEPTPTYRKLFSVALECFDNVSKALRPGATTDDILQATSVIEENGFTVYDSLVHGEAGKNPELGSRRSDHTNEPFTFRENMVAVIQPQPITRDYKAGIQLGAAVVVKPNGADMLHSYPFKFPVCG